MNWPRLSSVPRQKGWSKIRIRPRDAVRAAPAAGFIPYVEEDRGPAEWLGALDS